LKGYIAPPEEKEDEEIPSDVEQMAGVTEEEAHTEVPAEEVVAAVEAADVPASEDTTVEKEQSATVEEGK
jgi:hypothetical protein